MGGGIAGLTTAYRLRKAGFNVTVYEKLRDCGGLATCTKFNHNSYGNIYIENEWHVIAGTYSNMLFLMKEIGILNNIKSVKNYLFCNKQTIVRETDYCPGCKFNIISIIKFVLKFIGWKNIKIYDIYLTIKFYLLSIMISDERRINELDEISIGDYLTNASIKVKQLFIGLLSICCGLNEYNTSLAVTLRLCQIKLHFLDYDENKNDCNVNMERYPFYSLNGPIQYEFIQPLVQKLIDLEVNIKTHCEIIEIVKEFDKIECIKYKCHNDNSIIKDNADFYVNSMNIVNAKKLFLNQKNFKYLYENAYKQFMQINFIFNKRLNLQNNLMIYGQNGHKSFAIRCERSFWKQKYFGNGKIKDFMSFAQNLCPDTKSILYNKKWCEMTKEELINEGWNEFKSLNTQLLNEIFKPFANDDKIEKIYDDAIIWKSNNKYSLIKENDIDENENKNRTIYGGLWKFVSNKGCMKYQPSIKDTKYKNLFHSISYAKSYGHIDSMDTAVEIGNQCAINIIYGDEYRDINMYPSRSISLFESISMTIDKYLFTHNIKHPLTLFLTPNNKSQ